MRLRGIGRLSVLPLGRVSSLAGGVTGIFRRRDSRHPRVRLRLAHGETRVLAAGDAGRERLLSLARDLVRDYGRPGNARR
jgi:hypothetical protein